MTDLERDNYVYPGSRYTRCGMISGQGQGLSLRDAAALAALQGMLAHATRYRPRPEDSGLHWHQAVSREAFQIADAFLAARSEEGGESWSSPASQPAACAPFTASPSTRPGVQGRSSRTRGR